MSFDDQLNKTILDLSYVKPVTEFINSIKKIENSRFTSRSDFVYSCVECFYDQMHENHKSIDKVSIWLHGLKSFINEFSELDNDKKKIIDTSDNWFNNIIVDQKFLFYELFQLFYSYYEYECSCSNRPEITKYEYLNKDSIYNLFYKDFDLSVNKKNHRKDSLRTHLYELNNNKKLYKKLDKFYLKKFYHNRNNTSGCFLTNENINDTSSLDSNDDINEINTVASLMRNVEIINLSKNLESISEAPNNLYRATLINSILLYAFFVWAQVGHLPNSITNNTYNQINLILLVAMCIVFICLLAFFFQKKLTLDKENHNYKIRSLNFSISGTIFALIGSILLIRTLTSKTFLSLYNHIVGYIWPTFFICAILLLAIGRNIIHWNEKKIEYRHYCSRKITEYISVGAILIGMQTFGCFTFVLDGLVQANICQNTQVLKISSIVFLGISILSSFFMVFKHLKKGHELGVKFMTTLCVKKSATPMDKKSAGNDGSSEIYIGNAPNLLM